jgi:hypothetical protein
MTLHFDIATAVMALLGFLLHFTGRWAEWWRTEGEASPIAYLRHDPPGWLFATVATVAAYLILPEIGGMVGMAEITTTPGGAFLVGYAASSLGAKLPAILGRGAGVR